MVGVDPLIAVRCHSGLGYHSYGLIVQSGQSRRAARSNPDIKHVLKLSRQDQIWNRACLESGGSSPAAGDRALASLLRAHGFAMNGGVIHALECLSHSEIAAAIAGFNFFGLIDAANVFEQPLDDSRETEERLNLMYLAAVPNDDALVYAFRTKLVSSPGAFAPTEVP